MKMAFSSNQSLPLVVIYSEFMRPEIHRRDCEIFEGIVKKDFPTVPITVLDISDYNDTVKGMLSRADVLVTDPDKVPDLAAGRHGNMPNLKWIQFLHAGYDPFQKFIQESKEVPKYKVTRMGGTYGMAMAEYVVGYIISRERHFSAMREDQKLKQWNTTLHCDYRRLADITIGIVGAGDIGSVVAKVCKAFGMRTIGLVRQDLPLEKRSMFIDEYRLTSALPSLLAESDYICNILPSNRETKDFFKEDIFSHCTKKPVFINIGRGNCLQETTLIKSLREGWLSGAVLDVTDPEPLAKESKLWTIPEVIITPHVSGYAGTSAMAETFSKNYAKFLKGEPLDHEIDVSKL